jgi:DNA-binding LacI/PurR family transcriptional regulator
MIRPRDIADRLGLSQAHVSMALRGSPRVDPLVRRRVLRLAAELGYRPDAIAGGLADRRWKDRRRPACQMLAWIGGRGHRGPDHDFYLGHVRAQAEATGYRLAVWWADDFPDDAALLAAVARRKIGGVILSEPHRTAPVIIPDAGLPWVRIGHAEAPAGTTVRHQLEILVPGAVHRLRAAGHRRLAFLLLADRGDPAAEALLDGWSRLQRSGDPDVVAMTAPWKPYARLQEGCRWAVAQRADAVVVHNPHVAGLVRASGWSGAMAVLCANDGPDDPALPGWRLDWTGVARLAIDQLDALIRRGASAEALGRSTVLVAPRWLGPHLSA